MNELKNLQATGLTNLGAALKQAFDLLNLYRLQSGIDNYGMVRTDTVGATLAVGTIVC
jgi:Mg-chelatase subunit ChlD